MEESQYEPMSSTQENEYELAQYVEGEIEPQPHIVNQPVSQYGVYQLLYKQC